jgi:phosphoglycolate phosphatase
MKKLSQSYVLDLIASCISTALSLVMGYITRNELMRDPTRTIVTLCVQLPCAVLGIIALVLLLTGLRDLGRVDTRFKKLSTAYLVYYIANLLLNLGIGLSVPLFLDSPVGFMVINRVTNTLLFLFVLCWEFCLLRALGDLMPGHRAAQEKHRTLRSIWYFWASWRIFQSALGWIPDSVSDKIPEVFSNLKIYAFPLVGLALTGAFVITFVRMAKEYVPAPGRVMTRPYRAYLFDFDLTLVNTADCIIHCCNHALTQSGYPAASREDVLRCVGRTVEECYLQLTGDGDFDAATRFHALWHDEADLVQNQGVELFPDTVSTLEKLRAGGAKTAIVSNKNTARILCTLEEFGIAQLFDLVLGIDQIPAPKPAPDGLLAAMAQLGVSREETLYIGDSFVDMQTAAAAGVPFAAVTTGTTTVADFQAQAAVWPLVQLGESLAALAP